MVRAAGPLNYGVDPRTGLEFGALVAAARSRYASERGLFGSLIRESKTFQLPGILQTGQLSGMNTMDQALLKLAEERKVDAEAAMDRALKKEPFEKLVAEDRLALA